MRFFFIIEETSKIKFDILILLYHIFKSEFHVLNRDNMMYLSLCSFITDYLVQSIPTLHLMLGPFKGIFLLFLIPDHMLITLMIDTLGRFLGLTLMCSSLNTFNFVKLYRGIDELNIFIKIEKLQMMQDSEIRSRIRAIHIRGGQSKIRILVIL